MPSLTKAVLTIMALANTAVFADIVEPVSAPDPVTVPCETVAWNFGASALFLRPTYDANFGYYNFTQDGSDIRHMDYSNTWKGGFKLEGSYHWGPGHDINLSWYHFRANTSDLDSGPFTILGNITSGSLVRDSHWDALNAEFAQLSNSGATFLRFYGGVQFAKIKTEEDRDFPGIVNVASDWTEFRKSEFNGFGPRIGLDFLYHCGNGFDLYIKPATALLVGSSSFKNESGFFLPTVFPASVSSIGSKHALVPELEAKLGFDWIYSLAQGDLAFDFGYMWFNYFNAEHNFIGNIGGGREANFGASGLYFGLVYTGFV